MVTDYENSEPTFLKQGRPATYLLWLPIHLFCLKPILGFISTENIMEIGHNGSEY